ncbi:MAG: hypothetical protein NC342_08450 [Pseudoflavonifractor sp.]|nr:hypothetical protein [Alloprevotella sp.]MCM1117551.1 hypothetical protein [Pseudoflavonifractor sp.]
MIKKIIFSFTAILSAMFLTGCEKDVDGDESSYCFECYVLFEDADGNDISSGMACEDSTNVISIEECRLGTHPEARVKYRDIEGKRYIELINSCDFATGSPWSLKLQCHQIFNDYMPHDIVAHFVMPEPMELATLISLTVDGVDYPAEEGNRVVVRLQ